MAYLSDGLSSKRAELDDFRRQYETLKAKVEQNGKFIYTGKMLKNLTGLNQLDLDEIMEKMEPFKGVFQTLESKEAVMIMFAYTR